MGSLTFCQLTIEGTAGLAQSCASLSLDDMKVLHFSCRKLVFFNEAFKKDASRRILTCGFMITRRIESI